MSSSTLDLNEKFPHRAFNLAFQGATKSARWQNWKYRGVTLISGKQEVRNRNIKSLLVNWPKAFFSHVGCPQIAHKASAEIATSPTGSLMVHQEAAASAWLPSLPPHCSCSSFSHQQAIFASHGFPYWNLPGKLLKAIRTWQRKIIKVLVCKLPGGGNRELPELSDLWEES